ncbi:hypothetical protein L226DRAFT_460344 [Lentinus tigrinus ALCF2SS1-7]|uniref:Receptor-activated Ca2+-permeable cation channel n=1 Tax=Lentinus tigrinus ALCF2SS1-6 TaxID=1328759 RepID=A0A5C2SKF7_9APHY|nr:hypothetical protein L227DRAFT_495739 [Lentinus tigrinus ALCF2SS1-6]RPD76421.1 hypothetical protein L226DRAFT_460344 [Lentinus tigrinus ALCF2SS1-7]
MTDSEAPQLERQPLLRSSVNVAETEVYPIIHMIRSVSLHTPLTHEALTAPDLTYTLIRPLLDKYATFQRQGNMSVIFCLLLNRVYFFRDRHLTTSALSRTRADLCEILAIRALREHADDMLELALVLTTSWSVYSGAPSGLLARAREENDDDLEDRVGNAIEMAILSQAKRFIKSSPCQKVIDGIWIGKIVYQAESTRSILSDTYKRNPIHFYDPHKAPLLDHYRLKVPAIRSVLEYTNFLVLFVLFVCAIEFSELDHINLAEIVFMVYALGFTLEKVAAMQEHGIKVYFKGTWNGFDLAFVTLYCTYAIMRFVGVYDNHHWAREMGVNSLALIAVLMFPRLAFVTFKNNVMVLSLRAMIIQFVVLMIIAAFCFGGFLYALWTLGKDNAGYSAGTVAWWMLDLWFGLDASGFDNASKFHPVFGPLLMITYACLSNTLLLTGVSRWILSHTFSTINDDAAAEAMFRRAVSTIEGVKADSLFSYQPPVNLLALCIMLPASYILTPRWFHKVNVFMIRLTSFPILLCIALYERQAKRSGAFTFYETVSAAAEKIFDTLPRHLKRLTFFEGLTGPEADIDAIFELEEELEEESAVDMEETDDVAPMEATRRRLSQVSRRRPSGASHHTSRRPSTSTGRSTPPVPASPHKTEFSAPGPSTTPQSQSQSLQPLGHIQFPRPRVNSIVTRGLDMAQAAASPLAQIFQPLIVDDDLIPEEQESDAANNTTGPAGHGSGGGPPALVSYGPATRRRLMSMHAAPSPPRRMRTYSVAGQGHPQPGAGGGGGGSEGYGATGESSTALRRFPTNSPPPRSQLGLLLAQAPLSESPDERAGQVEAAMEHGSGRQPREPAETASQLENEENHGASEWERRLDSIEERQKRIEDMLVEISKNLRR